MLRVAWSPVARAQHYEIWVKPVAGSGRAEIVKSDETSAQLADLAPDTGYQIRVRAAVESDEKTQLSKYSDEARAKTATSDQPRLLTPQLFNASTPAPGEIEASWEDIPQGSGYELQYATNDKFKDAKTTKTTDNRATKTKMDGGVTVHLRVRTVGAKDEVSVWTPAVAVTPLIPTDPAPVRIGSYNVTCHSCSGPSWSTRRIPVASVIANQNPDVVGIQEAQQSRPRGFGVSQFADLVRALAQQGSEYRVTDPVIEQSKGTRIFYKPSTMTLIKTGSIRYSAQRSGASSRHAAWAILRQRSTGRELAFFSTHLEPGSYTVRLAQARQLAASMSTIAGGRPVVAVGDFNASQYHYYAIHQAMTGAGLVDPLGVQRNSTVAAKSAPVEKRINTNYDSYNGFRRPQHSTSDPDGNGVYLDYVFTSPMRVTEFEQVVGVDASGKVNGVMPSDHNMLRANIILPD